MRNDRQRGNIPEEFAVELKAVAKKFGAVTAVNDVSLCAFPPHDSIRKCEFRLGDAGRGKEMESEYQRLFDEVKSAPAP